MIVKLSNEADKIITKRKTSTKVFQKLWKKSRKSVDKRFAIWYDSQAHSLRELRTKFGQAMLKNWIEGNELKITIFKKFLSINFWVHKSTKKNSQQIITLEPLFERTALNN